MARKLRCRTLILGAGAAGMMAAAHSGPETIVIDHAKRPGEKIRISGGGRCNFTNYYVEPERFLGSSPHFHKSALARYTQWDFIELVGSYGIAWHEKTLGQLFCDNKATRIVEMLRQELLKAGAALWLQTEFAGTRHSDGRFLSDLRQGKEAIEVTSENLVVATGGKSIPKMGATGLAYDIARKFDHALTDIRPGLVPFTFDKRFADISGVSTDVVARAQGASFEEALLFTHRGLSGPAALQISSFWREGEEISVNLVPRADLATALRQARQTNGRRALSTELGTYLPARLVSYLSHSLDLGGNLADLSDMRIDALATSVQDWRLKPSGTEGYRTAEVTLGGVDTNSLDSRTMMSKHLPGLYFIGEAVDVTGWLGGYNFQWAWSSGVAAGRAIRG